MSSRRSDDMFPHEGGKPFEMAVAKATERAVGKVVQETDRRLVRRASAITGTMVAIVVSLLALLVIRWSIDSYKHQALTNALANCAELSTISEVLGSGNHSTLEMTITQVGKGERLQTVRIPEGFISSDAYLRTIQQLSATQVARLHPGPLRSLFLDPETHRLELLSQRAENSTTNYWRRVLVPSLQRLARTDCPARIG